MRRASRRGLVGALIGVFLVGALAGALVMAWLRPAADTSAIDNAGRDLLVTAPVERQPVRQLNSLSAQVLAPTVAPVMPNGQASGAILGAGVVGEGGAADGGDPAVTMPTARSVVSGQVHAVGDLIGYGDLVAEVSGAPVFAVAATVPLYRDLVEGAEGNDVAGLQQMLSQAGLYQGKADGKLESSTLRALSQMYDRAGYKLPELVPGKKGLPLSQTALVPGAGLPVATAAGLGEEISADHPLLSLQTTAAMVTARADMLQAEAFPVGAAVSVQIGSDEPAGSTVTAVSDFREAESSTPAGYDLTIALPEGVDATAAAGQPVIVREQGEVPLGTAVPLTAIRRDANGQTYVLVAASAGAEAGGAETGGDSASPTPSHQASDQAQPGAPATSAPLSRVAVTVTGQVAGYAIVADDPALPVGAAVVLAGA